MGKIKELALPATYTLKSIEKVSIPLKGGETKQEDAYTYEGDNGAVLCFHAHPTKAWHWLIDAKATNDIGMVVYGDVISAFISATIKRSQRFDEAIKTLKV